MTQSNQNGSRLDRIEAIMFDLATASVRHDNAMTRHDNAMTRHDEEFSRINQTLDRLAEQQRESAIHYEQRFSQNEQSIGILTASIQELRNL